MELKESERVELKRIVNDRIGQDDHRFRKRRGREHLRRYRRFWSGNRCRRYIDGEMLKISNLVHDAICPEVAQFVHIEPIEIDGKPLILVSVE